MRQEKCKMFHAWIPENKYDTTVLKADIETHNKYYWKFWACFYFALVIMLLIAAFFVTNENTTKCTIKATGKIDLNQAWTQMIDKGEITSFEIEIPCNQLRTY